MIAKLVVSAVVLAHIPFDADVMMSKKLLRALMDVGREVGVRDFNRSWGRKKANR